ncbi:unnamed protein product [Pylaiella littoralis]
MKFEVCIRSRDTFLFWQLPSFSCRVRQCAQRFHQQVNTRKRPGAIPLSSQGLNQELKQQHPGRESQGIGTRAGQGNPDQGKEFLLTSMTASPLTIAAAAAVLVLGFPATTAVGGLRSDVDEPSSHFQQAAMTVEAASTAGVAESAATGGTAFSMQKTRTYVGQRADFADDPITPASSRFPRPPETELCKRWAVLRSVVDPTETVKQLAELPDWCVVVVGDENGPIEYDVAGVTYLRPDDQEALPYRVAGSLPWNHLARKNVGYMYAIHRGAEVIYDVDDGHALMRPEDGVPHAHASFPEHELSYFSSVAPINEVGKGDLGRDDDHGRRIGVVQALANIEPDVDAVYRLTSPSRVLPFSFDQESPAPPGSSSQLRVIPSSTFAPYNAQATLHFPVAYWGMLLPATVHGRVSDILRSYFTQTLLPSVGAVAAFAPAWVEHQTRTPDNNLADFLAELPLHRQNDSLVEFLLEYRRAFENGDAPSVASSDSIPSRLEAFAVTMFEYGIVGEEHVPLTQAWLQDLRDSGYDFREHTEQRVLAEAVLASDRTLIEEGATEIEVVQAAEQDSPKVLLVIAIVSIRPNRRNAIRQSWMAWADERVQLRFFTEPPIKSNPNYREALDALQAESDAHGDLVMMDIDSGMNFSVKLLWAIRWMSQQFTFHFFLRLDDDYFLCLRRLLDELDATLAASEENDAPPLKIFAGCLNCINDGRVYVDEAYLLLTEELVARIVAAPDLQCSRYASLAVGRWFTQGQPLNILGDVEWVNDPRLDHFGEFLRNAPPDDHFADVCATHMGVHRAYPDWVPKLWQAAKAKPGPGPEDNDKEGSFLLRYVDDGKCPLVSHGVSEHSIAVDKFQPCDNFTVAVEVYCGHEGC